jgi:hypothetical protein
VVFILFIEIFISNISVIFLLIYFVCVCVCVCVCFLTLNILAEFLIHVADFLIQVLNLFPSFIHLFVWIFSEVIIHLKK